MMITSLTFFLFTEPNGVGKPFIGGFALRFVTSPRVLRPFGLLPLGLCLSSKLSNVICFARFDFDTPASVVSLKPLFFDGALRDVDMTGKSNIPSHPSSDRRLSDDSDVFFRVFGGIAWTSSSSRN